MPSDIKWKIHLNSSPEKVYSYLSTSKGRKKYWAESAEEINGQINFIFINGQSYKSRILAAIPHSNFKIEYFNSIVTFDIASDGKHGTDLQMVNGEVIEEEYLKSYSGWISVLLALKAAVDFDIDLRNHDTDRTWNQLFVDN
ncbi:MAG: hypothetical protein ACR2MT_10565 [Aurantibacter sp.]